jgi:hypothetical protein
MSETAMRLPIESARFAASHAHTALPKESTTARLPLTRASERQEYRYQCFARDQGRSRRHRNDRATKPKSIKNNDWGVT